MHSQDYLYMLQICLGLGAVIAVFLVFRYETIDKYTDNRKETLRQILDVPKHPERAIWIQDIGKKRSSDEALKSLGIPSVHVFIHEIGAMRRHRADLIMKGKAAATAWAALSVIYLVAHMSHGYGQVYHMVMPSISLPFMASLPFLKSALGQF